MHTPVTFLYEDAAMAVVDKPAGVSVIPTPGSVPAECLRDRVGAALGGRAWVVHRLDRDTSGLVVFARTAEAQHALSLAFEGRDVLKRYVAFVHGVPEPPSGDITLPLRAARRGKSRPAAPGEEGAREAFTAYAVTRTWRHAAQAVAEVEARPGTQRHHQIRVHLRAIGTPILGDPAYGRGAMRALDGALPVPRLALHASALDVPHPSGERRVVVEAPLAADLATLAAWLDARAAAEATS